MTKKKTKTTTTPATSSEDACTFAVATPSYLGTCSMQHRSSVAHLAQLVGGMDGIRMESPLAMSNALVDRARNRLLVAAMADPFLDVLLWLDDDVWWEPNTTVDILSLVARCYHGRKVALAGINYPTRGLRPTARVADAPHLFAALNARKRWKTATGLGTGLLAANLNWFRREWPVNHGATRGDPYFQSWQFIYDGEVHSHGEDYDHCDRVRARGGETLVLDGARANNGGAEYGIALLAQSSGEFGGIEPTANDHGEPTKGAPSYKSESGQPYRGRGDESREGMDG